MDSTLASCTSTEVEDLRRQVAALTKEVEGARKDKQALQISNDLLKRQLANSQNRLEAQKSLLTRYLENHKKQSYDYIGRIEDLEAHVKRLESGNVDTSTGLPPQANTLPDEAPLSIEPDEAGVDSGPDVIRVHNQSGAPEPNNRLSVPDTETATMALVVQVVQHIGQSAHEKQALILAPTRELARRLLNDTIRLSEDKNITAHLCVGGTNVREEMEILRQGGIRVIVGTPGRVMDMIHRRALQTDQVGFLGLGQADEMLSRGFKDQIIEITKRLPSDIRGVFLFATKSPEISEFAKGFDREPIYISTRTPAATLKEVAQYYFPVEKETLKFDPLCDVCKIVSFTQAVVFCNTRRKVDWLTEKLRSLEFDVSYMHGGVKQELRGQLMEELHSSSSRVIVTTDLLSGAFDFRQSSLIINYDFPLTKESYLRRIGDVGAQGHKAAVVNLVTAEDMALLHDIEQACGIDFEMRPHDIADLLP